MTSGSISSPYFIIWQINWFLSFSLLLLSTHSLFQHWPEDLNGSYFICSCQIIQFRNQIQTTFWQLFKFLSEYFFLLKNAEFWEIYFFTKFVTESIKMNLHTSYAPFWNEISVSNLLIWSNLEVLGFQWDKICTVLYESDSTQWKRGNLRLVSN